MTCGHRTVAVSNEIGATAGISQVKVSSAAPLPVEVVHAAVTEASYRLVAE